MPPLSGELPEALAQAAQAHLLGVPPKSVMPTTQIVASGIYRLPVILVSFADDPLVRLVSLMDHAPGQRQFVDVAKYREYNQGRYGLTDAQLDALVERRLEERARYAEEHRAAIQLRDAL